MHRINATIDNIDSITADKLESGCRYEVLLDWADGDQHETDLHFRLVELTATQPLYPPGSVQVRLEGSTQMPPGTYVGHVTSVDYNIASDTPEVTMRVRDEDGNYRQLPVTYGGLDGKAPLFEAPVPQDQGLHRKLALGSLADLLAAMITLSKISPRVLGIPGEGGLLADRIYEHITQAGGEQYMGKHGDGKPADTKNPPSTGGGKHEKGGKGK